MRDLVLPGLLGGLGEEMMIYRKTILTVLAGAMFAVPVASQAISFNLASQPGTTPAVIEFNGDPTRTITFPAANDGFDFVIQAGAAGLNGLLGNLDGTFTVGAVTNQGFGIETAPVSGTGVFSIFDGANTLTADVAWTDIFSLGTTLGLNVSGNLNITNIVYSGSNADLMAMDAAGAGILTVSAQFVPGQSLSQLMSNGALNTTSYSGTYAAVPEPATLAVVSLAGAAILRRRRKV